MAGLTVAQVLSGTDLGLTSGLADLLDIDISGRRVLYALGRAEGALVEIEVQTDGTLAVVDSLALSGTFAAGSDPMLAAMTPAGSALSLALAGMPETWGQAVSLGSDGSLGSQETIAGAGTFVAPVAFDIGGTSGLVSGRLGSGGLNLFTDTGGGMVWRAGLEDSGATYLADVADSVTFELGGADYVATVSATENGVTVASVGPVSLVMADAFGAADGLPISTPDAIGVIERGGETLLAIGALGSSSLSILRVGDGGAVMLADHILDSTATRFQNLTAMDTQVVSDFAYLAAGGSDGGISLFTVLPGGRLVHLDTVDDDDSVTLYHVSAVEMGVSGSDLEIDAASEWEAGLTRLSYDLSQQGTVAVAAADGSGLTGTALDDQLVGSDVSEALVGGAGNDILLDMNGQDTLTGGSGADLFVFHNDGQVDTVTDYERGVDRLDLSAFDFLYDVSQLTVTATSDGAMLSHGAETVVIVTADAQPLTAEELTNATILNQDRPSFLPVAQVITGGTLGDVLNGAAGADTISGGGGGDTIDGLAGDDSLSGGDGADTIAGGAGDDLIDGGLGNDVIYGDDWPGP